MTREEAIKELKNIKENIFWGDEYGVCFRDEWVEAYEMAISALREQTKLATNLQPEASFSCKWRSVKERLPDVNKTKSGYEESGAIVSIKGYKKTYYRTFERACVRGKTVYRWKYPWGRISDEKITHWMPLPEPPKEDET